MNNKNKQEENIGAFFDHIEKKKEKSAKIRRIIGRIMRLIIPFFLVPLLMLFGAIVSPIFSSGDIGRIGIAVALAFIVFFPLYSLIYGIFATINEKGKYRFALYNSVVSTMQFLILDGFDLNAMQYYIGILFTILFWTLIPIWIYNNNHNNGNEESLIIDSLGKLGKSLLYLCAAFLVSIYLQNLMFSDSLDISFAYTIIIMLFFILFPLASFFYSKKFIPKNTKKLFKSVICPAVLATSYLIACYRVNATYLITLVLFVWCEIWSLIGLKAKKSGTDNAETGDVQKEIK